MNLKTKFFFLDKDGAGKEDFKDKISIRTYIFEPCKCIECNMSSPNDEKKSEMTISDHLVEFLYRESQRNVRKTKLELVSTEQSFEEMKAIAKRKKAN